MKPYRPRPKGAKIVIAEYKSGITDYKELAEKTGYTLKTVLEYLHKYWQVDRKHCITTKKILEELKEGKRQSDIARDYNVSRQYVSKVKKKYLKGESYGRKETD